MSQDMAFLGLLPLKRIFDHPNKVLVDNDGEFDNTEFQALCENVNIRI